MPDILSQPAADPVPDFVPANAVADDLPDFVPANATDNQDFVPATPADPYKYLNGLPPNEIVLQAKEAKARGEVLTPYIDAYVGRVKEGKLWHRDLNKPETSLIADIAGLPAAGWHGLSGLMEGGIKAVDNISKALGEKGLVSGVAANTHEERRQAMNEVLVGGQVGTMSGLNDLRKAVTNVANRFFRSGESLDAPDLSTILTPEGMRAAGGHGGNRTVGQAYRDQFDADLSAQEWLDETTKGQHSPYLEAQLGTTERAPVKVDPETVDQISPALNLTMLTPFGAGFKSATAVPLAAGTLETAAKAGLGASGLAATAGATARGLRAAQQLVEGSPLIHGLAAAGVAELAGADPSQALLAGLLGANVKSFGVANATVGRVASGLEKANLQLLNKIPPGPMGRFAASAASVLGKEGKAMVVGQLANMPFLLGAQSEDEFKDMLATGLAAHTAGYGLGTFTNGLSLARNLWSKGDRMPETRIEVKDVGEDAGLDLAHRRVVDGLNNGSSNFVQAIRDWFGKERGELYTLFADDYVKHIDSLIASGAVSKEFGEAAKHQQGFTYTTPKDAEGNSRNIALSRVTPQLPGLSVGHEAGHLLELVLSPEELNHVYSEVAKSYTQEELDAYKVRHEAMMNAGLEEGQPRQTLGSERSLLSEIFAENASGVLNSLPVGKFGIGSGTKSLSRTVYSLIGRAMEKIGARQPQLSPSYAPKVATGLGLEPSARLSHVIENIIQAKRLDGMLPGDKAPIMAVPGEVSAAAIGEPVSPQSTVSPTSETSSQTENGPLSNIRPVSPKEQPAIKRGDPVGNIHDTAGVLQAEDAVVSKINGDGTVDITYTHPDTGEKLTATIKESDLPVSKVTPTETMLTPGPAHPSGGKGTVIGAVPAPGERVPVGPKPAVPVPGLPVPQQVENTVRPQAPVPAAPNVRTTPEAQNTFAAPATDEIHKSNRATLAGLLAGSRDGKPAVETDYYSAKSPVQAPDAAAREQQRKAADAAETAGPNPLRAIYQKVFVPYRWTPWLLDAETSTRLYGDAPRSPGGVFGMSMDKVIQNVDLLRGALKLNPAAERALAMHSIPEGYLSSDKLRTDIQTYLENQAHGYAGDGGKLVRPGDTKAGSITPEDPNFNPRMLPKQTGQLVNMLMGLEQQQTRTPGMEFAARFAELNSNAPKVVGTDPQGRNLVDTNPIRVSLKAAGVDPRILNAVIENLPTKNFTTPLKVRTDLHYPAGDTGIMSAGFMPEIDPSIRSFLGDRANEFEARRAEILARPGEMFKPVSEVGGVTGSSSDWGWWAKEDTRRHGAAMTEKSRAIQALDNEFNLGEWRRQNPRRFMPDTARSARGNDETRKVANGYIKFSGLQTEPHTGYATIDEVKLKRIADFYEQASHEPSNPEVQKAYSALAEETMQQYAAMEQAGVKIEPFVGRDEPYKNSAAMLQDVRDNKHLFFLKSEGAFGLDKKWGDTTYRANNYNPPRGASVHDLVSYEGGELGNEDIETQARKSASALGIDLSKIPANKAVWVTRTPEQAKQYGEQITSRNTRGWVPLVDLGEDGGLLVSPDVLPKNPMLEPSGVEIAGNPLLVNDVFRAVHDYFGHTADGYEFGPRGEYNAYLAHSRMFSDEAKPALAAETLAQNAWVNFGPHMRDASGKVPRAGEPGFVSPKDRRFADQKNTLVPQELLDSVDSPRFMPSLEGKNENPVEMPRMGSLQSFFIHPNGKLYHAGESHYDFAVNVLGKNSANEMVRDGWTRINISPQDDQILVEGRISREARKTLDDLRFSQNMEVVNDDGRTIFPKPEEGRFMPSTEPAAKKESPTGWVLPNGEYKGAEADQRGNFLNTGDWHNEFLFQNKEDLKSRFGFEFKNEGDDRKRALDQGFVRIRYDGANGRMGVEARVDKFNGAVKRRVEDVLEQNLKRIDRVDVNLFNRDGQIVRQSGRSVFSFSGQEKSQAVLDTLNDRGGAFMPSTPRPGVEEFYRGEFSGNRGGKYYSTSRGFAREFTQTGRDEEVTTIRLKTKDILTKSELPYAGDADAVDAAVNEARVGNYRAVRLSEGQGQPDSIHMAYMPATPQEVLGDFKADTLKTALRRPGWTILTATQEKFGDPNSKENSQANLRLEAELKAKDLPYEIVKGSYNGVDQGKNFLVTGITEKTAQQLGKKYGQEAVLTNRGYVYQDGSVNPLKHADTVVGDKAKQQPGYSVLPDGTAFSAGINFDKRIHPDVRNTQSFKSVAKYLTPGELKDMQANTAKNILDVFNELPADADFETAAKLGMLKRGWYERAGQSLLALFGDDTEKFVSLLAATSPQQPVQENLAMSFQVWRDWLEAGRPTDTGVLQKLVKPLVDLDGRLFNVVRALQGRALAESPEGLNKPMPPKGRVDADAELSGNKVESFRRNLLGDLNASTNDTWMAKFGEVEPSSFGQKSGYLAYSAKMRRVADTLGIKPAEVQETIWSFFRTLFNNTTVDLSARDALAAMTPDDIIQTPEFAHELLTNPKVRNILKELHAGPEGEAILERLRNLEHTRPLSEGGAKGGLLSQANVGADTSSGRALARIVRRAQSLKDAEVAGEKATRASNVVPDDSGPAFMPAPKPNTPEFKKWFGNSKVVDKDNNPKLVFHGTDSSDFTVFERTEDIGYHFGTAPQANARIGSSPAAVRDTIAEGGPFDYQEGRRLVPVFLKIENPLTLPDLNDWSPRNVAAELVDRDVISHGQSEKTDLVDREQVRDWLATKGYDGIRYRNTTEAKGSPGYSYIVFDPEQVKSATGNSGAFDSKDPDIRFMPGTNMPPASPRPGSSWSNFDQPRGILSDRKVRMPVKVEDNFSRHSSFTTGIDGSVVLHSANLRSTGYLTPDKAKEFEAGLKKADTPEEKDSLIESYF